MDTSKFILENQDGEAFNLTAPNEVFLVNVEGLGTTSKQSFVTLHDGFFRQVEDEQPQNGITGDLIFRPDSYRTYQMLVDWLISAKRLYFRYTPQTIEYRKEVTLRYLRKAKRDGAGWMRTSIAFHPLTPWYVKERVEIKLTPDDGHSKAYYHYTDGGSDYYGYQYTDNLKYGRLGGADMSATLAPMGHDPAGFVLRYYGSITNPKIRLVGSKTYGLCSISGSFVAGDVLELSTLPDDCHVWKISGGVTTDLVLNGSVDLHYAPYPRIPTHEPSTLSVESTGSILGNAELTVYPVFRSV